MHGWKGLLACWVKQRRLKNNVFNANMTMSSSAILNNGSKQMYVAYVRIADHKPTSICAPAIVAVTDASAADPRIQESHAAEKLQNVFVEQQSTV